MSSSLSVKDEEVLAKALQSVPQLAAHPRSDLTITRLGGLTNIVFKVVAPGGPFCLRCPGPGTESYIRRSVERTNAEAAARAGVAPAVLHFADDGAMLMPLLSGETMSPQAFRDGSNCGREARRRAGRALQKLHASGETFGQTFELFEQIDACLGELGADAKLPDGYHETLARSASVREALSAHPLPSAPCHCDPLCENFISDAEGAEVGVMHIVDFEYGGMNDPMWDLADLSVEAGLDAEAEQDLLGAYFGARGAPPTACEVGRVACYRAMCDLLWTLWGLLQHKNGNPAEDFWAYSVERFERCKALMATEGFEKHVASVASREAGGSKTASGIV